jgi:hypothetical protein
VRDRVADRAAWLQPYLLSEEITTVFDTTWQASLNPETAEAAKLFLSTLDPSAVRWRTLGIPVEVPLRRHLTTVRLTPATPGTLYEGRAIEFDMEFITSLAWLGDYTADQIRVTYDVQASADDWIVVGKKRGIYTATVSSTNIVPLVTVH